MTQQFQVGQTYATRSIGDYDCIHSFTILARTAKTISTKVSGKTVTRRLSVYDGAESFKPFGTYSMCATIYATNRAIELARAQPPILVSGALRWAQEQAKS